MKMRVSRPTTDNINVVLEVNEHGLMRTSTPTIVTAANGVFYVPHDLKRVPDDFGHTAYGNVIVWATAENRLAWSDNLMVLTGSAAIDVKVWALQRL